MERDGEREKHRKREGQREGGTKEIGTEREGGRARSLLVRVKCYHTLLLAVSPADAILLACTTTS